MGKSKKDKKSRQGDDLEDDLVSQTSALSIEDDGVTNGTQGQKQKKKDKKKKDKKRQESDDEAEEEEDGIAALAKTTAVTAASKKPAAGFSAFSMLQNDDDDNDEQSESEEEEESSKPAKKETKKGQPAKKEEDGEDDFTTASQKSKKKKSKKGKGEEDIDAILAEIEKPAEKSEKKKKKKAKQEDEDEIPETETPQPPPSDQGPKLIDFSTMTQDEIAAMFDEEDEEEDKKKKKKKKKEKGKKGGATEEEDKKEAEKEREEGDENEEEEDGTVKTAAQKKKEKKERQRLQKLQEKQKQKEKGGQKKPEKDEAEKETAGEAEKPTAAAETKEPSEERDVKEDEDAKGSDDEDDGDKKKKKKDRRKKKDEKEKEKEKEKKKPGSRQLKVIQELQAKVKEEEERLRREEEEKETRLEEARQRREEEERKKQEKKEKEKQKKKERIERAKAEGRYLNAKQKEAQRRAQQLLEAVQAQGVQVPLPGQAPEDKPKKKPIYTKKKKPSQKPQLQQQTSEEAGQVESAPSSAPETPQVEEKPLVEETQPQLPEEEPEEPKEAWDVSSGGEEDEDQNEEKEDSEEREPPKTAKTAQITVEDKTQEDEEEDSSEEEESSEEESSEDEDSSEEDSSSEEDEKLTPAEKAELRLQKARERIQKRKAENEAKRSTDRLRAPVVCVLGHVDTGKTKILDKLRRTHVQDGEAGGITQQIGATNVPQDCLLNQTKMVKDFAKKELKLPGLLIIDTPGHESFSNLRSRGSGLCDIAILVIDIMHGLEPQTIESINLLKSRKTPFIVALNKIDRLYMWQSNPDSDVHNTIKKQKPNTKMQFDERAQSVILQLAEQGLNAALFYDNKNVREYISLVPTSAHSGDGMGNLIALICELCQTLLAKRLAFSEELQAVAMEVKSIPGLGTTVDVILVNGRMKEGQTIVMAGTEGPIVTTIRGLLMPQPLRELRVKNAYTKNKEVEAAQGVKVIAKDMEKALAGLPVYVAQNSDEVEVYKQEIQQVVTDVLDSIKVQEKGVYVQASTLGSLEALLEFLKTSKIPFAGINIGPVHKRDVMKASTMLERESQFAVILAFDVKVERDAQEFADSVGVRIFTADIIYHLFDAFMGYREELKRQKQEEFKHVVVYPCKLKILPNCVFNSRDPIVVGVQVEAGFIKVGTPLCVPSKQFVEIGRISSIEFNHKPVEIARKGNEVCIKVDAIPGEAPKLVGRHFEETDQLVSKISRQSIDVLKDYFRDDMTKNDWQLIMEMKKTFAIL